MTTTERRSEHSRKNTKDCGFIVYSLSFFLLIIVGVFGEILKVQEDMEKLGKIRRDSQDKVSG